jgi:flagellar hook-associated protein 1 FlgK
MSGVYNSSGLYNIGIQSLMVYQNAMNVVSQNLANVDTPFYCRKLVNFSEGLNGTGVNFGDVNRVYSESASQNAQVCASNFAGMDVNLRALKSLEPLLDDDTNNVAKYLNDAISALTTLNTSPGSYDTRKSYLDKLTMLSNQFSATNNQMQTQQQVINQQLQSTAASANDLLQNIAAMNQQISQVPPDQDTSALLDQREQLVQTLAQYMDFSSQIDSQGQVSIALHNGIQLLSGSHAVTLSSAPDASYPTTLDITIIDGNSTIPVNTYVTSGQIGGLLSYRNTLYSAQQALGRLSLSMAQALNSQNKLGMDYNGNLGTNIFNDINSSQATANRSIPNINNTGTANLNVSIQNPSLLTTSDYQLSFDTPNHYKLTRLSDNSVVSSGAVGTLPQTVSADGFNLNITSGTLAAGDKFIISPTQGAISNMSLAISDPKLLALALPVVADATVNNTGNGAIQLTAVTDTTNAAFSTAQALNPPIQIQFLTDNTYQLVNTNTNAVMEGPITYTNGANVFPTPGGYNPGYQIKLSGNNIAAGDTFNINYNVNGASDNRNGLLMLSSYQNGSLQGGSLNFMQGYRLLSGDVSRETNSVQTLYTANQTLLRQAKSQYNEVSAVNAQEESVNLMGYQQAYQASAQILQTARSVFDEVINMLR